VTAIALSLAAALAWGMSDFVGGLKSRQLPVAIVLLWVQGAGLIAVLAVIVVTGEPLPDGRTLLFSIVAGVCGLSALAAFYRALSIGTMSIVAPISATGITLPVVVGLASGDMLSAVVAAGLVVTFAGVLLASREEALEEERAHASRTAIVLAVAAAAGFGGYFVFSDVAADGSILWLLTLGRLAVLPVVALVACRQGHSLIAPAAHRPVLIGAGLVDLGATALYGLANTHGALSIVSVIGSLYPVVTILLARVVLHERITRTQTAGVAAALVGVAMVSAG
jgi:drug/metabolite transporter (DMT)-like permease